MNLKSQLNLFEDKCSLIRSKERVTNANLPYETKYPVADLIIRSVIKTFYTVEKNRSRPNYGRNIGQ